MFIYFVIYHFSVTTVTYRRSLSPLLLSLVVYYIYQIPTKPEIKENISEQRTINIYRKIVLTVNTPCRSHPHCPDRSVISGDRLVTCIWSEDTCKILLAIITQKHVTDTCTISLDSSDLAPRGGANTKQWLLAWYVCQQPVDGNKWEINIQVPSCTCGVVINGFIQSQQDFL